MSYKKPINTYELNVWRVCGVCVSLFRKKQLLGSISTAMPTRANASQEVLLVLVLAFAIGRKMDISGESGKPDKI